MASWVIRQAEGLNARQKFIVAAWLSPTTSCLSLQVSDGVWIFQLNLTYFDHLTQDNVSAVAVCENPGVSLPLVPLMTCKETEAVVKLPVGTKLKRVTTLGKPVVGNLTTTGAEAEYVKISTDGETVR